MAGLLGSRGMPLRKPNIVPDKWGAFNQGLGNLSQEVSNIFENIQRNAQFNMTKDMALYEFNVNKASDSNYSEESRLNFATTAQNIGKKIFKDNNPELLSPDRQLLLNKDTKAFNKSLGEWIERVKNKEVTFREAVVEIERKASEYNRKLDQDPYFTVWNTMQKEKGVAEKEAEERRGLIDYGISRGDIPMSPTNQNALGLLGLQRMPLSTVQHLIQSPYQAPQEKADIEVNKQIAVKEWERTNPVSPTPQYGYYTNSKGERVKVNEITGEQAVLGEEYRPPKESAGENAILSNETRKYYEGEFGIKTWKGMTYRDLTNILNREQIRYEEYTNEYDEPVVKKITTKTGKTGKNLKPFNPKTNVEDNLDAFRKATGIK